MDTVTTNISNVSESQICVPCLICREGVPVDYLYNSTPRICDKCKDAVMSLRRLLEYLEEESNEDT